MLLFITFIESFATVMLERGLYFYTENTLGYGRVPNLTMAFVFGLFYVAGALLSHRITVLLNEKRTVYLSIGGLMFFHIIIGIIPTWVVVFSVFPLIGFLSGLKWPVIESYISAGHNTRNTLRMVGRFNCTWALSVPLAVAAVGPILELGFPRVLFFAPAAIHLCSLILMRNVPTQPLHLPDDHPDRPPVETLQRYTALLGASRWTMLASYALLFLLAPLMPSIFNRLQVHEEWAPSASTLLDVIRVGAFFLLGLWTGWHGRLLPLLGTIVLLPIGFFMVLYGNSLAIVLIGEVLFGFASGMAYFSALYYAMAINNASVDAGGVHESLIGLGFALGPLAGLVGLGLANTTGSYETGMLIGVGPIIVLCLVLSIRSLQVLKITAR